MTKEEEKKKKISFAQIITMFFVGIVIFLLLFILISPQFRFIYDGLKKTKIQDPIMKVSFLYVGQGDCTIIRDLRENGKTVVIDAGPSVEVEEFMQETKSEPVNYVKNKIIPYLLSEGIENIDYLILSHKDMDHIGGMQYLLENYPVSVVVDNGLNYDTPYLREVFGNINKLENSENVELLIPNTGSELYFSDDAILQIIGPLHAYYGSQSDDNNNSLVLRFAHGDISYIFPGDAEIEAEMDMLIYGKGLQSTILKMPHHGSTSSSSTPFLDHVKPEVAILSCGRNNRYGFPVFEIISRYEEKGSKIYRTDLKDNIEILSDGKNYEVRTNRK